MSGITRPMGDTEIDDITRGADGQPLPQADIERRAAVLLLGFGWSDARVCLAARLTPDAVARIRADKGHQEYVRGLNIEPGIGLSIGDMTYR